VRIARRHDCELRVIKRGNRWLDITGGLRTNRVNVGLRDGRVKKVYGTF
jgi:N-acyl-D-aspartate/D-glutamate deacylase